MIFAALAALDVAFSFSCFAYLKEAAYVCIPVAFPVSFFLVDNFLLSTVFASFFLSLFGLIIDMVIFLNKNKD